MKKVLSVILSVMLMVTALPLGAFNLTASAATDGYYTYTVTGGKATITDVNTSISGDIVIPNTLGGYSVTKIGDEAFQSCRKITGVTIPNTVTTIGEYAFYNCTAMIYVDVPDSITSMGSNAFNVCSSLEIVYMQDLAAWCNIDFSGYPSNPLSSAEYIIIDNTLIFDLEIPNTVTTIKTCAFSKCAAIESVTIPSSVTTIESSAFAKCPELRSVVIPNSVTNIEGYAFEDCTSLKSITIPESLDAIGMKVFNGCTSLSKLYITDKLKSIGWNAFNNCNSLNSVYFLGDDKSSVSIDSTGNDSVINATWYCTCRNHIYDNDCDTVCNRCEKTRSITHVYSNNCDANCNVCDFLRTVPDHIYTNSCDTSCNECGLVRTITHTYDNACDEVCNVCAKTRTITHSYVNNCAVTCNICGYERVPFDHVYSGVCDTNCNVCGDIRTAPDHTYSNNCDATCNICGYERVSSDHTYSEVCDTDCNVCGYIRTAANHTYRNDCDITCDVCGYERVPFEHVYSSACDADCNVCGFIRTVPDHIYSYDCDATCNICGYERVSSDHTYSGVCDEDCNVCGDIRTAPDHTYSNDCDATCNICGAGRIINHIYDNNCDAYCNECGKGRTPPHTYDNKCDADCNDCKETRVDSHIYEWVIDKAANCKQTGLKHEECTICHIKKSQDTVIPITHVYDSLYDSTCNLCGLTSQATQIFNGGHGTESSPYLISTKAQLDQVRNYLTAHFKLTCDIVFTSGDFEYNGSFYNSGKRWMPIGTTSYQYDYDYFTGSFDGNGFTIKNLYVDSSMGTAGLFGYNKGIIKNLLIDNCTITAYSSGDSNTSASAYAGGIVAQNTGTIINCGVIGTISAGASAIETYASVGGIAGYNNGTIANCYSSIKLFGSTSTSYYEYGGSRGYTHVGGIVGVNNKTIINCHSAGDISASAKKYNNQVYTYAYAGGIVGDNIGTITNCYTTCISTATSDTSAYFGGIAGYSSSTISNCYFLDNMEKGVGSGTNNTTKCTIEQLTQRSTYIGFDFENDWVWDESLQSYPCLRGLHYHTYDNSCDKTCNTCGSTRSITHTYTNNCDDICNVCGITRTPPHNYYWIIDKANNCGVDGIKHEECSGCHAKRNINTKIAATGEHTLIDDNDIECDVCGQDFILIKFDLNVGSNIEQERVIPNESVTLPAYYRNGYNFIGWSITKNGDVNYQPYVTLSINKSIILYAQWNKLCTKCGGDKKANLDCSSCTDGYNRYYTTCPFCKGSSLTCRECGSISGCTNPSKHGVAICSRCDGGRYQVSNRCSACSGVGYKEVACTDCNSNGEVIRTAVLAPEAPVVESVTSSTVVLKAIENGEYSIDGINWQTSPMFNDLVEGQEYTFYQRYAKTDLTLRSEASISLKVLAHNHTFDNDCDVKCNLCDYTRVITHDYKTEWDKDDLEHWYECLICKHKNNVEQHDYDNACDTECGVCGQIRTVPDHSYTLNGNHTCDICRYSKTPAMPVVEIKTNNSVTLVKTNGFEYSKDGTTWQTSNVFANLLPNTTYTFYQRVKASSTAAVSGISEGVTVAFKLAQDAPIAPIISSFTDTTVTLMPNASYEYSKDGAIWQTSNVFTGLSAGTKYTFYQRYAETDTYEASNISDGTRIATDKSKQNLIPNAPTVQSFTTNSITLTPVDGCEYSKNGTTWQSSNVFNYLACGTEYTFYQRYKETDTTYAGKSSVALVTKTDKGTQTAPSAPALESKTHNTVTLRAKSGYEYSRDGINWQSSNVFTGLDAETNYMFYCRKAETETHYASESSKYLIVKTNEQPTYTPGDINDSGDVTLDDVVSLAQIVAGWQGVAYNEAALDVNRDGSVTLDDVVLLAQFVAGWGVTLS